MHISTNSCRKLLTLSLTPINDHRLVGEYAISESGFNDFNRGIALFDTSSATNSDSFFHGESERCGEMTQHEHIRRRPLHRSTAPPDLLYAHFGSRPMLADLVFAGPPGRVEVPPREPPVSRYGEIYET
jgi:hypothetical protein